MWIIDTDEARTKEDYINLLNEINAYRELDGQDFDFGTGLIINEMSFGSEDAYYEMDIWSIESLIEYWDYEFPKKNRKKKKRENKYARNRKHKNNLWKMIDDDWMPIWNCGKWFEEETRYPKRYYRGKRSAYLKKQSNKKIRQYKGGFEPKGNKFHRVFDFWWELD
jgi:hypothetical protein